MEIIAFLNKYVFGTAVPIMLVIAGIYYLFLLKGFHITKSLTVIKAMLKKRDNNGISPFKAVSLALAGTLGVGNIVGVSAAIYLGGFGAIFWMWMSALCAMLLKYAEIVLAMKYRVYDKNGSPSGSAMLYIRAYFNSIGLSSIGKFTAAVFAVFCIVNALTMGNMIQINAITRSFEDVFSLSPLLLGICIAILVFTVISKGVDVISNLTEKLVPVMSIGYVVLSLTVMILKADMIGEVFYKIFLSAFEFDAALGGVAGFICSRALRYGTMRGLISNEAGCGTAPTAHAVSNSRIPAEQGFWGIFEVFVDTIVLCTMTAIVVMISYPEVSHHGNNFIMMTISAYSYILGDFAKYFLVIAVLCFAFATVICWAHYGLECTSCLSKKTHTKKLFVFVYSLSVVFGAILKADWIWEFADLAIGSMTFINVIVICLMSKEVKRETELYFKKG